MKAHPYSQLPACCITYTYIIEFISLKQHFVIAIVIREHPGASRSRKFIIGLEKFSTSDYTTDNRIYSTSNAWASISRIVWFKWLFIVQRFVE